MQILSNFLRTMGGAGLTLCVLATSACNSGAISSVQSVPTLVETILSSNSIATEYNKAKASSSFQTVVKSFHNVTWAALAKAKPSRAIKIDDFAMSSLGTDAASAADAFGDLAAQDLTLGKTFAAAGWKDDMPITLSDLQGAVKVLKEAGERTEPFNKKEQLLVAKLFMASLAASASHKASAGLALASGYIGDRGDGWSEVSAPDFGDGLLCFGSLGFFCNKHSSKLVRTSTLSCKPSGSYGLWGWSADGCSDATTGNGSGSTAGTGSTTKNGKGYNSDGYNAQGYNDKGCNAQGYFSDGKSCHPGQ